MSGGTFKEAPWLLKVCRRNTVSEAKVLVVDDELV
jgi:hypothetical protein